VSLLRDIFPAVDWLSEYGTSDFQGDLSAGATVGVMLIPQSMAYAMLAGVPPIYGLYAGLVPLCVYTFLGTARHLAVGPVTVDMLIVGTGVGAVAGSEAEHIAFAILVAAMTGLIEIAMGALRFGFMVNFLSRPVIAGFMTAAPLIIAANQLGSLTGIQMEGSQSIFRQVSTTFRKFGEVNEPAFAIGLFGVVFLTVLQNWKPRWPAALFWVVIAGGIVWGFGLEQGAVSTVGNAHDIQGGLPALMAPFEFENFGLQAVYDLAPTAVTLALVQFMYVMSLGKAFASDHDYSVDANRELFAIGASNVVGSFFRAIPVSGSFSRSAVNNRSGANTPLTNVFAALLVGLTLLFLTGLFLYLPISALAAIIMVACLGMIDVPELKHLLETRWIDGGIALVTFVSTLYFGIQEGILTGVGVSILTVLYDLSSPHVVELGHVPGTREFRDLERHPKAERISNAYIVRVDSRFAFANAKVLQEELLAKAEEEAIEALVIDTSGVNDLDTTATKVLKEILGELSDRNVDLFIAGAKGPVRDMMESAGLKEMIGESNFFLNAHQAISHLVEEWEQTREYEPSQQEDRREKMEEAREKLREERERLEDQTRSIDRERRRLEGEIDRHESARDRLETRREQLRRQLREAQERRATLESAREQYESAREEVRQRRESLTANERELDERRRSLDRREEELDEERRRLEGARTSAENHPEEARERLESIVEERSRLRDELDGHADEWEAIEETIEWLEDQFERAEKHRDELREERRRMTRLEERLREEREELEAEQKRLEGERKRLEGERKRLEAERDKATPHDDESSVDSENQSRRERNESTSAALEADE